MAGRGGGGLTRKRKLISFYTTKTQLQRHPLLLFFFAILLQIFLASSPASVFYLNFCSFSHSQVVSFSVCVCVGSCRHRCTPLLGHDVNDHLRPFTCVKFEWVQKKIHDADKTMCCTKDGWLSRIFFFFQFRSFSVNWEILASNLQSVRSSRRNGWKCAL